MAVASVYEFAVPAPHDADFIDGEMALAVASPMNSAAGETTFYLSRWFDFAGGTYTFRAVADDSAVWIAAIERSNGRVLFASAIDLGVTEYSVYVPRGRQRLDLILVNTSASASNCWTAFSIWKSGKLVYTSSAAGWVFDTAVIDDVDVPDIGDRRLTFPLFSIMPNWRDGIVERLQLNTEIFASEADIEQRRSIRRYARRTFEAEFARWEIKRARLDTFIVSSGKNEVLVPLWHEQFILTSTLGSTLVFPEDTRVMREFHVGDLVAVIDGPTQYEILTIESAAGDEVTFADAPSGTWSAGSKIYPLRVARILDVPQFSNPTDSVGVAQIRFSFDGPETWPLPDWGYCVPYFKFRVNRATEIETEFERPAYLIDSVSGPVELVDVAERERVSMRFDVLLKGRSDTYAFRQFVQQTRGRAMRFWMPTHARDLFPSGTAIGGAYMDVLDSGYFDLMLVPQDARRTIGIFFLDGRPAIYRNIESVVRTGAVDRLFVDRAVPPVEVVDVDRVSFIMPVRFEQDSFELHHHVDDSAAITLGVAVRSTDRGDLPDIECFVTSKLYPIEVLEAVDMQFMLSGGSLVTFAYPDEALDLAFVFSDGTLRNPLVTYSMSDEAADVSFALTSGELRTTLLSYSMVDEAADVAFALTSGELRTGLISYDEYPPEALDTSWSFTGGTLS